MGSAHHARMVKHAWLVAGAGSDGGGGESIRRLHPVDGDGRAGRLARQGPPAAADAGRVAAVGSRRGGEPPRCDGLLVSQPALAALPQDTAVLQCRQKQRSAWWSTCCKRRHVCEHSSREAGSACMQHGAVERKLSSAVVGAGGVRVQGGPADEGPAEIRPGQRHPLPGAVR